MQTPEPIQCPKCNSTQITAGKKGFSGKKAVAGAVLNGGIGLLAGTIGSNKVIITCLNCGNQFKPGATPQVKPQEWKKTENKLTGNPKVNVMIFCIMFLLFGLLALACGGYIFGGILIGVSLLFLAVYIKLK